MEIFEVGEEYANRNGTYTVLEINDPKMMVQYADGTTAELSIAIQQRIWENIVVEQEVQDIRAARTRKKKTRGSTRFYVKPTSVMTAEELSASSKPEGVPAYGKWLTSVRRGDRLLYYAQEKKVFFAVVTITAPGKELKRRERPVKSGEPVLYFPVDVDTYIVDLDKAVSAISVELESQPDFRAILNNSEDFLEITEDEFELLAEMLTEVSEEDDENGVADVKEDEDFVS